MADELAAPESSGTHEVVRSEALGVLGNVSAWNFPYFVGANVWAPVSDEKRRGASYVSIEFVGRGRFLF